MDWDDLKVFLHIARSGLIVEAGRSLCLDHSTVSRRLVRLESQIGAKLFDRAGRRLHITAAGESLLSVVTRVESIVLKEVGAISHVGEGVVGRVRIGAPEGLGAGYLGSRLATLALNHPDLEIELVALPQNYSLASREVDIAITLDRPATGNIATRRLTDYSLGFFAKQEYLDQMGTPTTLENLRGHSLCGYIPELLHTKELNYLESLHLAPRLRSTSIVAQREIIEAGQAIGVLPFFMTVGRIGLVSVLKESFSINRSYWLSIHEDLRHLIRIRTVSDALAVQVRSDGQIFLTV